MWRVRLLVVLQRFLVFAGAIAAVSSLGSAYYWLRIGRADIFSITLKMSLSLTGGEMANWRLAGFDWVARQWWVLAPLVLTLLASLVWVRRRVAFEEAVIWGAGVTVTVFYYIYQIFLNGTFLQLFYYFSYILPVLFLQLMLVVATLVERVDEWTRPRLVAVFLTSAIAPWFLYSLEWTDLLPDFIGWYLVVVVFTIVLVIAAVRASSRPSRCSRVRRWG